MTSRFIQRKNPFKDPSNSDMSVFLCRLYCTETLQRSHLFPVLRTEAIFVTKKAPKKQQFLVSST